VEHLGKLGDAVPWGGPRLCADGDFPTPDGKARFSPVAPAPRAGAGDRFVLSTRRGKQFNSMVFATTDPLTGASRDALFIAAEDAEHLGLRDGARVVVRSEHGALDARVRVAPIRPGNVQVFFPEGNVLLPHGPRDPGSGVPDYNTEVEIRAG
jgi:anaerobic selenocysteine-containing dehydrogenase